MQNKYSISIAVLLIASVGLYVANPLKKHSADVSVQIAQVSQSTVTASNNSSNASDAEWINKEMNAIESQAADMNKDALHTSLVAYQHAEKQGVTDSPLLTIVDYSKPSSEKRLWVVNLDTNKVLFNTWVAHGKNSGSATTTSFSNQPESLKSSIGVFVTEDIYSGKHGGSLRVQGLESGFNSNAFSRDIVFHGAAYVSGAIAKTGKIGRSWGCWAVSQDIIPSLIKTIKNKVLVVAYYPDKKWLNTSNFLN